MSNFTPEVVLWPFPRMRTESGKNRSKCGHIGKHSGPVRNGTENLILDSMFKPAVQPWPFLRMRNSKLGKKKPWRRCGTFTETSRPEGN